MTPTYLCTLPLPDSWFDELRRRMPDVTVHRVPAGAVPSRELLAGVHLLHTSTWFPDVTAVPELRCVQLDTSGVDHVRPTSLWATEVPIATLGGIAPVPMGEYAMMAILGLAHRMPRIERIRAERSWPSNEERLGTLTPAQLSGATVGIVGYGRVGREVARLAMAFGMHPVGVRRTGADSAVDRGSGVDPGRSGGAGTEVLPAERLDEALRRSDVLVVVVPLTDLTRGMLGAAQLDLLPHGALVVNIARGGIVDEVALLERLRDGRIGGVAVDVFDDEPLPADSPWWSEPGAIVTPHVAGLAPQYHAHTLDLVVENLTRLVDGRPFLNEVDRVAGY